MIRAFRVLALLAPVLALAQSTVNQGQGQSSTSKPWTIQGPPATSAAAPAIIVKTTDAQRAAFGAVSVASEQMELHLQFPYTINTRIVTTSTANGGTVTQAANLAVLQTSANAAGAASLASLSSVKYTPGQGISVRFTAIFPTCTANSKVAVGLGDTNDGLFFACSGASFGVIRRQNGVDTFTAQTAWNGDKMLGGSGSVQTLNTTVGNVYTIDFQWLGFGDIRFFAENAQTGEQVLVHTIRYANANTSPSIFNPSLPLRAEVTNSGNASNLTLSIGSMGAAIQGPRNDFGVNNSFVNFKSSVSTITAIFSIQNRTTFNRVTNRTRIKLTSLSPAVSTGTVSQFRVIRNGTIGGSPSFSNYDTTRSVAATDTAGTSVTNGDQVFATSVVSNQYVDLENKNIRIDPGDTYSFTCESTAGGVNCGVAVSWREEF